MKVKTKHIKVESEKENLKKIRATMADFLNKHKITGSDLDMLLLATDELCANVIIHANKDNSAPFIDIEVKVRPNEVMVEILDQGRSFNMLTQQENDLLTLINKRKKGGLGIMLIKRVMDRIEYFRKNNQNIYRMYKKLNYKQAIA